MPYRISASAGRIRGVEVIVHRKGEPHTFLVDDDVRERYGHHKWSVTAAGYINVFIQGAGKHGRYGPKNPGHYVLLHRLILGLIKGDGKVADHISGDRSDNRRTNLRVGTQGENMQNTAASGGSRYRGVSMDVARGTWRAYGKAPGMRRTKFLGRFATEAEAAEVAAAFRAEHMPFAVALAGR